LRCELPVYVASTCGFRDGFGVWLVATPRRNASKRRLMNSVGTSLCVALYSGRYSDSQRRLVVALIKSRKSTARPGAGDKRGSAQVKRAGKPSEIVAGRPFPRLRIMVRPGLVLGPGKIELLEAIERTGSISAAGREMGMSYRRAWLLVSALNEMFGRTLVSTSPGGAGGGGAEVTAFGSAVADAYRRADDRANAAIREEFARIGHQMDGD
jgi:molybdate transport system regulatory protein